MRDFISRVQNSGPQILWFLNGHRMDFSKEEYREMISEIRRRGLFPYLSDERPALLQRLHGIVDDYNQTAEEPVEDPEREFILEQMIFDLQSKL
ncbi:MAG: hypothetical protein OEZ34_02890 [Spirochaetia bacterium]|nr:hypothetical protein [Spirochaetia bacterium]